MRLELLVGGTVRCDQIYHSTFQAGAFLAMVKRGVFAVYENEIII